MPVTCAEGIPCKLCRVMLLMYPALMVNVREPNKTHGQEEVRWGGGEGLFPVAGFLP